MTRTGAVRRFSCLAKVTNARRRFFACPVCELMSLFSLDILEPSLIKRPSQSPRIPLEALSNPSTEVPSTSSKQPRKTEEPGPPRWNTLEFWFYGFVFVTVVPMMVWCAYDVSRGLSTRGYMD